LKLKFQTVAEKTAKNFRELLYFAAPGICIANGRYSQNMYALRWTTRETL